MRRPVGPSVFGAPFRRVGEPVRIFLLFTFHLLVRGAVDERARECELCGGRWSAVLLEAMMADGRLVTSDMYRGVTVGVILAGAVGRTLAVSSPAETFDSGR